MSMVPRRGITLTEVIVAAAVFSIVSIVLFAAVYAGQSAWLKVDDRYDAAGHLRRVELNLRQDLKMADPSEMRAAAVGSGNGFALWFLSATDYSVPTDQQRFVRDIDGRPDWQRNILYYLIRPADHDAQVGHACGNDPATSDAFCPHKVLIRKEINQTTIIPPGSISTYTTAPTNYNTASMVSGAVTEAKILSDQFLYFTITGFVPGRRLVNIDLAATRVREASKKITIGGTSLLNSPFTSRHFMLIVPQNDS